MSLLEIDLLGPPLLRLDERPLQVRTVKAIPLLAYLALNPGSHHRISLATLLWTELDQERAFAALRTTLWKLKKAGLDDWIEVQRDQLGLRPDRPLRLDVLDFRHLLGQSREHTHPPSGVCPTCLPILSAAVTLYRGDFMQGFSLRDALAFDDWQRTLADTLRDQLTDAMGRLVRGYQSQNDPAQAIQYARRWLALNRLNEEPHRQLMQLYASTGQRPAALNQYQECLRILKRSGLEPQPETTAVYHQILGTQNLGSQILGSSKHLSTASYTASELEAPIILCADIEDAAALWAHHRQNMARVLTQFTASIKELARRHAGQVAKINGDHAILLFERGQPLQFALALQKHSQRPVWDEVGPLKVRIAIHAAEIAPPVLKVTPPTLTAPTACSLLAGEAKSCSALRR